MKIRTIDSSGYPVEFTADDNRVMAFDTALRMMMPALAGAPGARSAGRDGDPLFHAIGQLTYLERQAQLKEYEPLIYEQLLGECITSDAGRWASNVDYETVDHTGIGKRLSPSGDGMPMADVVTNKTSLAIAEGGIGYSYTLHDLEVSARGITPLPQSKQEAAIVGYKTHMNDIGIQGEAASGFTGVFNDANVPTGNRPSGAVWDNATPDTIMADINALLSNVYTNSKQNSQVKRIALPPSRFQRLMQQRSSGSDKTVLAWLMDNNLATIMTGQKLEIVSGSTYLETAGAAASKRMVGYTPKQENIKMHVPMPLEFGVPQPHMNKLVVPSRYRYGGVNHRKPYNAYYMDGL